MTNVVGRSLTHKTGVQQITTMQKRRMVIVSTIMLGPFAMVCPQEVGAVESDSLIF